MQLRKNQQAREIKNEDIGMNQFEFINEIDLYIAYKKTKFELFNDKNSVLTIKLFNFEKNLEKNIASLYKKLHKNGLKDIQVGSFFEYPKSLEYKKYQLSKEEFCNDESLENCFEEDRVHFFSSSLEHHKIEKEDINKYELSFRKIIDGDIEFHIISTLWVMKIGQFIDEKFSKDVYGSRLIRIRPTDTSSCEYDLSSQEFNIDSPRIYEQYQYKYQSWRNNSFKSIRELHKTASVIAITMDISKFYHSINPQYFLTQEFYEKFDFDKKIDNDWKQFHIDFINKIIEWNKSLSENKKKDQIVGIPIGLTASPVLANAIMKEFDKNIKSIAPTYYGRYVDDILLVFPDNGELNSGEKVLEYLKNRNVINEKGNDFVLYKDSHTKGDFKLKKSKQKIFYLDKNADLSIIDGMEAEINSVSSEWRFLPDIADKNSSLLNKIIGFYGDGKEFNDALRKIDSTTIKRLGLSLLISHSHSLNEYISSKEWSKQRYQIYDLIENHMFIPQNFINNYAFISRLFRLMIHSGDGERAFCFLQKVNNIIKHIEKIPKLITSNGDVKFSYFERYNKTCLREVLLESLSYVNTIKDKYAQKIIDLLFLEEDVGIHDIFYTRVFDDLKTIPLDKEGFKNFEDIHIPIDKLTSEEIKFINLHFFLNDLSFDSFGATITKFLLTKNKKSLIKKIINLNIDNKYLFEINISNSKEYLTSINQIREVIVSELKINISNLPFIFSTRLLNPLDVSIILNKEYSNFVKIVNAIRGNNSNTENKSTNSRNENNDLKPNIKIIANKKLDNIEKVNVTITNFKVEDSYWKDSVIEKPNKTLKRFQQLEEIVNEAVRKRPDYLVLPELAIPQEWAWLISKKLLVNNISLITGVEYIHDIQNIDKKIKQKIVHNAVMMFLISDDLGYKYLKFYRQDKTVAAYQEGIDLYDIARIKLIADSDKKYDLKDVYQHGNFFFSALICNELTDIQNRARLRGEIDSLFVIEWNRDVNSFNSYVESAALDIHSYVVQVNNRKYGDSRIRAPYKESFFRDIVQVKGGNHDYLIVGEIDIKSLREFQSHNVSPKQPFKPTPTGFEISKNRQEWINNLEPENEDVEE